MDGFQKIREKARERTKGGGKERIGETSKWKGRECVQEKDKE